MHPANKYGFSLIELSIVLVILGLLTGGILAGKSLIRAAEVRAVLTEYQRYTTAMRTFRDKYFSLPGDMINATSFWGSAGGNGSDATCQGSNSGTMATCNGNGNGLIDNSVISNDEATRMWQQMANAGLVEGTYTGVYGGAAQPGKNFPVTRLSSQGFWYMGSASAGNNGTSTNFATPSGNVFYIPGTTALFLKPEEAWNIDMKIDNGLPGSGPVIGWKGTATYPCTTAAGVVPPGDAGATYNLSNSDMVCYLFFYNLN